MTTRDRQWAVIQDHLLPPGCFDGRLRIDLVGIWESIVADKDDYIHVFVSHYTCPGFALKFISGSEEEPEPGKFELRQCAGCGERLPCPSWLNTTLLFQNNTGCWVIGIATRLQDFLRDWVKAVGPPSVQENLKYITVEIEER